MNAVRRSLLAVLVTVLAGVGLVVTPGTASAAAGDIGYLDQAYTGAVNSPTADKPQSKLWFVDGIWWADMFDTVSKTWHIFKLDRATQKWVDTGVPIDNRANSSGDAVWNGSKLYVASHVVTASGDSGSNASLANNPARLYRYSYDSARKTFTLDAGFPSNINNNSSESLTVDRDSTGRMWASWTQVSRSSSGAYSSAVYVNSTNGTDNQWGTPFVLPVSGANPAPDDVSALVAFGGNRIGVLWSNQNTQTVNWAVHADGAATNTWTGGAVLTGSRQADDHLNLKGVQADASGRVYAVVKTSADQVTGSSTRPQVLVLGLASGSWKVSTFGTIADCHTRPQLVLDEQQQRVHVVATAPTASGCAYSGAPGSIYLKSAPMGTLTFPSGRGTAIIRDIASANMNDATTSKQSVSPASGLVVLASNTATKRYWHADVSLGGTTPAAPTGAFTASTTSGTAPLPVQFTDTSTGSPTSWAWTFGDGGTSTAQNPSHTFAAAGTYTVTLRATNATGTSAPVTRTVTVTAAPPTSTKQVTAGSTTTASAATANAKVTITKPAGVANGDVLIAQVTADGAPSVSAAPAGWTTVVSPMSISSGARVFVYSHVVTNAGAEPASYTWTLSAAQKWGAVLSGFHGVDTTTPFDTAAATKVDTTYGATSLAVPSVTTATAGAMLVGGAGLDSSSTAVAPPGAWTETGESSGVQTAELAYQARPTAGATGTSTFGLSKAAAGAAWVRALRPAA
jgi:PKD repeat protein